MIKNFVIVKHMEDSGKYLFLLPDNFMHLFAGDYVLCDTARGKDQMGVCCSDSFLVDPNVVCPLFGTSEERMRYVTGTVEIKRFKTETEDKENAETENG